MTWRTKVTALILALSMPLASAAQHDDPTVILGGPLYGMATAVNGDLLVADAGVGVIRLRHGALRETIPLPGVRDVGPIWPGTFWAAVSGDPPGQDSGQSLHFVSHGEVTEVVNLFHFEQAYNPDGTATIESNPFDVQAVGPFGALVADAAANDLLFVDRLGNVRVLAIFPPEIVPSANIKALARCPSASSFCALPEMVSAQAVPTSVAIGRDGYIYVGELKGIPAPIGESNIWRVSPFAHWAQCGVSPDCVKVFDGGFTSIIDLAVGPDGRLYVAEMDERSWAARIFNAWTGGTVSACDVKARTCEEVAKDIRMLTAITFGAHGTLWATRNALQSGAAEVVAVERVSRR